MHLSTLPQEMKSSALPTIFLLALFSLPYLALTYHNLSHCSEDFLQIDTYRRMQKESNTTRCKKLATLQAQFAWNYFIASDNQTHVTILIGTKMITDLGWLAWGVNPVLPTMVGTQAIIAIKQPDESVPVVNTYNITLDTKLQCALKPSNIDVRVQHMKAEIVTSSGFFTMSAQLILPPTYNISSLKHVWQVGYFADGLEPKMHASYLQNVDSKEILNLKTGHCHNVGQKRWHLRKTHGILNIIGWGTLLPIGVIIARYTREYPFKLQAWFKLHSCCQAVGYILGSIGWGLGLLLGHESKYYCFRTHRILGICIFGFTTLQMCAFRLKPTKGDEYRKHWNVYHHFLGYALLVMIPVNIYQGIKILRPDNREWKWAYNGILVLLAMLVLALEIYTWTKFLYKYYKKKKRPDTPTAPLGPQSSQISSQPDQGTSK